MQHTWAEMEDGLWLLLPPMLQLLQGTKFACS
jgi:hypothetical protein